MATKHRLSRTDIDLAEEEVVVNGKRFTEADAAALADELEANPPVRLGRGRPSLSGDAAKSPQLAIRLAPALRDKLEQRAVDEGKNVSEVVRDALEAYTA